MIFQKIIAFLMAIFTFIASLFTGGSKAVKFLDVSTGDHALQAFDLYLPKQPADGFDTHGVVVYIHGGGWCEGDKKDMRSTCENLAAGGYTAAATLNYRMLANEANGIDYTDMLDDIDAALEKIKAIGAENGYTINRAALIGSSAGAHLAMLYSYSRGQSAPLDIRFVCSMVGPADFTDREFYTGGNESEVNWKYKIVSLLIGLDYPRVSLTADNLDEYSAQLLAASPVNYITAGCAPSLLEYGSKDILVPVSNADRLVAKLTDAGARFDYVNYPNSGHGLDSELDKGEGSPSERANTLIWQYFENYLVPESVN